VPPPPITLRQITAETLPALQALYEASDEYFLRHSGAPARPEQAAFAYGNVLESGDRALLGIWWEREALAGCFDLRFDHPAPHIVWFGALILRDQLPAERLELETWAVRILEEWLRTGAGAHEIRLALPVSDHVQVRFWTQMGYTATRQSHRYEIGGKRQRFVVYSKRILRAARYVVPGMLANPEETAASNVGTL
jgi:hypothetical protein